MFNDASSIENPRQANELCHSPTVSPSSYTRPAVIDILVDAGVQVLVPSDEGFTERLESYWSRSASALTPVCIARPTSASEVSRTIQALVSTGTLFAIRSGGHTQYAGANNIGDGGVTVDLGLLNWTRFHPDSETADIGPGARWKEVYAELQNHDRVVSGGRDGNVGVGGLVLGGGLTFFSGSRGFACDDVVAFEVVLADGRIVTATASGAMGNEENLSGGQTDHADLFRCLKGGSGSNFGVVTNIKMRTLKSGKIWAGLNFFAKDTTDGVSAALTRFTEKVHTDVDSHLLFFLTYLGEVDIESSPAYTDEQQPQFKDVVIVVAYVQMAGVERSPAYDEFLGIPAINTTTKMTTVAAVVSEYDIAPQGYHNTFFTATFKNDTRIVTKAAEMHEDLVEELKRFIPDGDFITQCLVQPLPAIYGRACTSEGKSPNILGIEDQPCDGLLFVAVAMVRTPEQEAFVRPRMKLWVEELQAFAATIVAGGGNLRWIYMNYADSTQKVLRSYGEENLKLMTEVAAKYDPQEVFQKLCPGGFKISPV